MTKTVRIENADTSDYKIKVTVQDLKQVGPAVGEQEWVDTEIINLDYPTAQTNSLYLTTTRRLIIEENGPGNTVFVDKEYIKRLEERAIGLKEVLDGRT